ncbi:MAG: hypothetical protein Q8M29_15335 [Bacteroidota bacterium]|nr:hypothetical protein [Bacteroidota bacterium]
MNATSYIQKMAIMLSTVLSINLAAQQATTGVTGTPGNNSFTGYDYKNGVGVRMGVTSGLTYKHKFNQSNAFEVIVNAWPYTLGVTALYERYKSTDVPGLNCYFGGGAHANIGGPYRRVYYYRYYDNRRYTYMYVSDGRAIGIDGIIGLEYKFKPIPLAISADIKPFTEVNNYGNFYIALDPSIGLKLTF